MPTSSEQVHVWLALYNENCTHGRHHETQRGVMTAFLMAASAAFLSAALADKSLDPRDLPFLVATLSFGLFGTFLCAKHHERFKDHMRRAKLIREELDKLLLAERAKELLEQARNSAKKEFPKLYKLRIHRGWVALHIIVLIVSAALAIRALTSPFTWQ